MHNRPTPAVAAMVVLALLLPRMATANWPTDPLVNVPLCTAPGDQGFIRDQQSVAPAVSDGAGGALVAWQDHRDGAHWTIYVQRVNAYGAVQWTVNGVALSASGNDQQYPAIASDGAGGAIVAWEESGTVGPSARLQHVLANGTLDSRWPPDGRTPCAGALWQGGPAVLADDSGGVIVAWIDYGNTNGDIYTQHVLADGTLDSRWPVCGRHLCTLTGNQSGPVLATDCAHGAVVAWQDDRDGSSERKIYARRVTVAGTLLWDANGVLLRPASDRQDDPAIVSDGAYGAIVAWTDSSGAGYDIYAQRVDAAGQVRWTANGIALCNDLSDQAYSPLVADGQGGAIAVWMDGRSHTSADVYAQRVDSSGVAKWTANGVPVCTASGDQAYPAIATDGLNGAVVAWQDGYTGHGIANIGAQHLTAGGTHDPNWPAGGRAVCTAAGEQFSPVIVPSGCAGAIVAWTDGRGGNWDIYAQRVQSNGQLGTADVPEAGPLTFALDPVRPNPACGGALSVRFTLPTAAGASLELLDVAGRRVAAREVGALGAGAHTVELGAGLHLAPGLYLVRLTQGANARVTRAVVLK